MKNNQWQIALEDLLLGENQASKVAVFVLQCCQIKNVLTNSKFSPLFLKIKKKIFFAHYRIFKDHDPNSRTFQGLGLFYLKYRTFRDFQGPWKPCILYLNRTFVLCPKSMWAIGLYLLHDFNLSVNIFTTLLLFCVMHGLD